MWFYHITLYFDTSDRLINSCTLLRTLHYIIRTICSFTVSGYKADSLRGQRELKSLFRRRRVRQGVNRDLFLYLKTLHTVHWLKVYLFTPILIQTFMYLSVVEGSKLLLIYLFMFNKSLAYLINCFFICPRALTTSARFSSSGWCQIGARSRGPRCWAWSTS